MYNDDDYIENLYSTKFDDFNSQTSKEEWNKLDIKLSRANFLKFSFTSFNVFYLAVFMSFAGMASYFGVTSYLQSKKIEALENDIALLRKQGNEIAIALKSRDTLYFVNKQNKTEIKNESTSKNMEKTSNRNDAIYTEIKQNNTGIKNGGKPVDISKKVEMSLKSENTNKNVSTTFSPQTIKPDSLCKKVDSIIALKPEAQKVKRVKKTVYLKQDNIVIKDTLVIKKKL
jgi:hypothetical protein